MAESNIQNMFLSALGSVSTATAIGKHFKNQKQIIEQIPDTSADENAEARAAGFKDWKEYEDWMNVMYDKTGEVEPDAIRKNLEDEMNQRFAEQKAFGKYQQATDTKRNIRKAGDMRKDYLTGLSDEAKMRVIEAGHQAKMNVLKAGGVKDE